MKTFKVTIWEHGCKRPIVTTYSGNTNAREVAKFFGCDQPDVKKYKVEEVQP